MTSFFSIKRDETGKWFWVLYAGNFREVLRSKRTYHQRHHARDAARRLHKVFSHVSFNYGKGFRRA